MKLTFKDFRQKDDMERPVPEGFYEVEADFSAELIAEIVAQWLVWNEIHQGTFVIDRKEAIITEIVRLEKTNTIRKSGLPYKFTNKQKDKIRQYLTNPNITV